AERIGLAHRCVDDDSLMAAAHHMAARAADVPRELSIVTKQTLRDMADIALHDDAVDREIEPQVWSTRQPWFRERLAALQNRISKKA
ncbi:MAG TPA: enoyl-CoA hydratase, partial [Acidimicrobiales bacterium]